MASVIEECFEQNMNVEMELFPSFLTEAMLDAAMTNIQDIDDDEIFMDDETSGISSNSDGTSNNNNFLEAYVDKAEEDKEKMNKNDIAQDKSEHLKDNCVSDTSKVGEKLHTPGNKGTEEETPRTESSLSGHIVNENDEKPESSLNEGVAEKDQIIDTGSFVNTIVTEKTVINGPVSELVERQIIEKTITEGLDKEFTDKKSEINTGTTLKCEMESSKEKIISDIVSVKGSEIHTDARSPNFKFNMLNANNRIISSIKQAFNKINTMREKRISEKNLTTETEDQIDDFNVIDSSERTEHKEIKKLEKITKTDKQAKVINVNEISKFPELKKATINNEKTHDSVCNNVENSSKVDKNYEEMDYDEISDDADEDDCGLEIDDNLEKEIENNLMAEIGLSPQAKKTCFVLDDCEVINDDEKEDTEKVNNESITLYRGGDTEMADASSIVECVLDSDTSSVPVKQLPPNTSYSENSTQQVKTIYVKDKQPQGTKQMIPILKRLPKQNKNVQYVLKLNGSVEVDSLTNKKLKLVPVQKSLLTPVSPSFSKVKIKDPTFEEDVLNKQIIENQIPPYMPFKMVASSTTYRCEECSDVFMLESSLKQHLTRRSVVISYWCRICCHNIKFYNRCVMLKHVRLHKQLPINIDPTSVVLRPLPKDMLETGLPKSITQNWEENPTKNVTSKFPNSNTTVEKTTSIVNKPKTLTSVISIPRTNVNQLANSNKSPPLNVTMHDKPVQNTNTKTPLSVTVQFDKPVQSTKNSTPLNVTVQHGKPVQSAKNSTPLNVTVQRDKPVQSIKKNIARLQRDKPQAMQDSKKNTNKSTSAVFIDVDSDSFKINKRIIDNSENDETSCNLHIDEVHSMNFQDKNKSKEEIHSAVAETVTNFKSLLNENTNEKMPRIFVESLPVVKNNLPVNYKVISLSKKNGMTNSTKINSQKKNSFVNCSECGIKVLDMEKHLNRSNIPTDSNLTCRVCRMILPTKCSLKIHLRVHMKLPPFKCPECGKQFGKFANLFPHLRYICGHLSRYVKYICSKCRKPCSNLTHLESHIFSLHTDRVFKCNQCPKAFFNLISVKKHKNKDHGGMDITPLNYQQCTLCSDLVPKGNISQHISVHARNPNQVTYAYQCPGCKKWYTNNKPGYLMHLSVCIKVMNQLQKFYQEAKINPEPTVGSNHNYSEDSDSHNEESNITRKIVASDEDVIEVSEKDPLSLEDWECSLEQHVVEKRIETCIVCKKKRVIILPGTNLNTQSLCCKLCVKQVDIEEHQNTTSKTGKSSNELAGSKTNNETKLNRKRPRRPVKRKINLDFEYETEDSFLKEKSDSSCSSSENKKLSRSRTKFKKPKMEANPEETNPKINFVSGQIIPEKQSSNVLCSKCGFKADNEDEFRNHVVIHRTDPNAYQCLECGLCFVVRPSLEKHLIVLHRIKNVKEYIQQNDVGGGQSVKEEDEEDTDCVNDNIEENQCRVCYAKFDTPTCLDKHFRTHGMAFLMSSQRQSKKL